MPLVLMNQSVALNPDCQPSVMPLTDFPKYLKKGLKNDAATHDIEEFGQSLIKFNFDPALTKVFIKEVCRWGNYSAIANRVLKNNKISHIAETLRKAHRLTKEKKVQEALVCTLKLHGLGVSFASKHLKFLDPQQHVVLDSIISERLGYSLNKDGAGYYCFLKDCRAILNQVKRAKIRYPLQNPKSWRVADIEMAIFNKIRAG